ncbi:MAG: hypothetical protein K8R69_10670 [Deltaproteobacteria bacterium]|nr:hypothetical protein [Deltaproteobacteria bacterium]
MLQDAGLGDVDSNLALANGVLRPMLRRLFRNPEALPDDSEVMRVMREFRETMRSLRLEVEGHRDLSPEMRRSILEAYAVEIASGRMSGEEALRLAREAEAPAAVREETLEMREEDMLPDETIGLTDSDFLPETPEVENRTSETPAPAARPVEAPVEIFATAPLPALLRHMLEQRYEAATERDSHAAAAREALPRAIEAMNEAHIDPETPLGQWVLSRILLDSSQGRIPSGAGRTLSPAELSRESLAPRIEAERRIFESLRMVGFEPTSREGLRLANFLLRRRTEQAMEIAAGLRNTLRMDLSPELVRAVDRLVLLGGDRSARARELWLEWALSQEAGPEALQDAFWETLSGVRELRLGANGAESIDRRERPTRTASLGEAVVQTLDELGIPSHSPAGSEIANLFLARSAVEASAGNPPFSFIALSEQATAARGLAASLREIFSTVPGLSASDRGALTLWALRNRCAPSDLAGMLTLLRGATSRERPSAPDVLGWILTNNPSVETLREIQGGEYRLRRGPGGLRLVTREGRAVTTDLAPHIGALREDFARDFGERPADTTPTSLVETVPLGIAAVPGGAPESARPKDSPTVSDAATLLNDPARRDEFEASLIELEDAGLLEPGTPLEEYHYPVARILENGASIPVYLTLEPTAGTMGRIPFRVVGSENGVLRLVRDDGLSDASAPNEIRLVTSRLRNPFRTGDRAFLLHGISGASEDRPPSDAPEAPELPGRGMGDAEMESFLEIPQIRDLFHPHLIDPSKGHFVIPPLRLPNVEQIDGHTELAMNLVNQGIHVQLEPTLADLDSIATELEAVGTTSMGDFAPIAATIREEIAVVRNTESDLGEMAVATRRLGEILAFNQDFPADNPTLRTFFRDRVLDLYRRQAVEAPPPVAAPEVQGTVRPPRPGPRVARSTERAPRPDRAAPQARIAPEAPTVREPSPASPEEVGLTAEMAQLAAAQLEEFSPLAQRTRLALADHDAVEPDAGNTVELQAWRNSRREIFAHYTRERDRIARELVDRHEGPGRRVLEFLQGLPTNEEVWTEVEEIGLERARIASDLPPHGRPKAAADVVPKIGRRRMTSLRSFTDLFGTRVIVESYEDAISLVAAVQRRFQVRPEYTSDGRLIFPPAYKRVRRGEAPDRVRLLLAEQNRPRLDQEGIGRVLDGRRSGYRAIHIVVEVEGLPVEIQIQTRSLYRWGAIQHDFYKNEVLALPENSDLRETTDRYFAEAARYLAQREQGILRTERPRLPEFAPERLARLPENSRAAIRDAVASMEGLMDSIPEEAIETESPRAHETPAIVEIEDLSDHAVEVEDEFETIPEDLEVPMMAEATSASAGNRPSDFDSSNGLHSSFLGAGMMMAMTSMGHDPGISLLAGIFGTVLPFGVLGIFNWVRNRGRQTPPPDGPRPPGARTAAAPPTAVHAASPVTTSPAPGEEHPALGANDGNQYRMTPYSPHAPAVPGRYVGSVDRVRPAAGNSGLFEVTLAAVRMIPGERPRTLTLTMTLERARALGLVNELGHTVRGARILLQQSEATAPEPMTERPEAPASLEAAPPPFAAPPPSPKERPLLQPNTIGGNLPEIDAHLAGEVLNEEQIAEVLRRHSRRVRLAGGELVYLADQGIDPKHPVGEDFMGGLEYRDPLGRRTYSMMVADGMGGMGHGDVAGMLTVEAFQAELRRTGDIRRAWELANASVRHFNFVVSETQDRNQAIEAARQWIANPRLVRTEEGRGGSGACSVSFSILPGAGPSGATVLQTHFAGDASLRVFRRQANGRLERVYSTVEENLGTIAADSRQERGENLHRTREIRLHAMANQVTNGVGSHAEMQVSDTSRGEIPQPNGQVARSSGFEHGLVLREGDVVLAGSDGFWENFLETRMVGDLIEEARSAEEIHAILREETHARMEIVRRVRSRDLPAAANGRFRFSHRGHDLFIDRSFNVYESETSAEPIDKFKPDNFSLAVYLHSPATVAAEHAPLGPTPQSAPLPPRAPEASRRSSVVPPPIPAAARRPRIQPVPEAPTVTMGPPVVVVGEHPYHLLRGGRLHEEERYLYQLRLDASAQSTQPFLLEVESPTPLTDSELERLVNSSRRPPGVEMREGWRVRDFRRGEGESAEREMTAIPIGMLPAAAGMRGVQLDFYLLASENTPLDTLSTNPRLSIVDPTAPRGPAREAAFSLGSSDISSPQQRSWVLRVQQDRIPVSVNGGTVLPFGGMFRLSPGDRIQVGLTTLIFRDGCLVPETTAPLRLSVPPAAQPARGLPLAAVVRNETPDPGPGPRRR